MTRWKPEHEYLPSPELYLEIRGRIRHLRKESAHSWELSKIKQPDYFERKARGLTSIADSLERWSDLMEQFLNSKEENE